jgi:mono/diheme cytochrome c family protein
MIRSMTQVIKIAVLGLAVPVIVTFLMTWTPPAVNAEAEGAADFKAKCASCHGADGKAATPVGKAMKIRDLTSADVQSQSDAELLNIISKGKGKMPGYEKTLGRGQVQGTCCVHPHTQELALQLK